MLRTVTKLFFIEMCHDIWATMNIKVRVVDVASPHKVIDHVPLSEKSLMVDLIHMHWVHQEIQKYNDINDF